MIVKDKFRIKGCLLSNYMKRFQYSIENSQTIFPLLIAWPWLKKKRIITIMDVNTDAHSRQKTRLLHKITQ